MNCEDDNSLSFLSHLTYTKDFNLMKRARSVVQVGWGGFTSEECHERIFIHSPCTCYGTFNYYIQFLHGLCHVQLQDGK